MSKKLPLRNVICTLQTTAEKDIVQLKQQLKEKELEEKFLKQQVFFHLINIGVDPQEIYERILGPCPEIRASCNNTIYRKIKQQEAVSEEILGNTFGVKWKTVALNDDNFAIEWVIEGQVRDIGYTVVMTTDLKSGIKSIQVKKMEFQPQSELISVMADYLKENNCIRTLIPSLYMIQKMMDERSRMASILGSYEEISLKKVDGLLCITLDVSDSKQIGIEWGFSYVTDIPKYIHNIHITSDQNVTTQFSSHKHYSVLCGERKMESPEEILNFIESFINPSNS